VNSSFSSFVKSQKAAMTLPDCCEVASACCGKDEDRHKNLQVWTCLCSGWIIWASQLFMAWLYDTTYLIDWDMSTGYLAQTNHSEQASDGSPCVGPCQNNYTGNWHCLAMGPLPQSKFSGFADGRWEWVRNQPLPVDTSFQLTMVGYEKSISCWVWPGNLGASVSMVPAISGKMDAAANNDLFFFASLVLSQGQSSSAVVKLKARHHLQWALPLSLACSNLGEVGAKPPTELDYDYGPGTWEYQSGEQEDSNWIIEKGAEGNVAIRSAKHGTYLSFNGKKLSCVPATDSKNQVWTVTPATGTADPKALTYLGLAMKSCAPAPTTTQQGLQCIGSNGIGATCKYWATQPDWKFHLLSFVSPRLFDIMSAHSERARWFVYHTFPSMFHMPTPRDAWCYTDMKGSWDCCVPEEPELWQSWSPTCAHGNPCLPWPSQGTLGNVWFSRPEGYHGCARPALMALGWRTSNVLDTRPLCLCEEGLRHCKDECSGVACPFGHMCVAGKCVGPCLPGWNGSECDEKIDGPMTCHEKQALGMTYPLLQDWATLIYFPTWLAVIFMVAVIPIFCCISCYLSSCTFMNYGVAMGEHGWWDSCGCCGCDYLLTCTNTAQLKAAACFYAIFKCSLVTIAYLFSAVAVPLVAFGLTVIAPVFVKLEIGHMERGILFCACGIGFTYCVFGSILFWAVPGYFFYLKIKKEPRWDQFKRQFTEASYWPQQALSTALHAWAYVMLPVETGELAFESMPWLTMSRVVGTVCYTSVASFILIGGIGYATFSHTQSEKDPYPLPPKNLLDDEICKQSRILFALCWVIIFGVAIFRDLPAIMVPYMSYRLGSSTKALSEFNVYGSLASLAAVGDTLMGIAMRAKKRMIAGRPDKNPSGSTLFVSRRARKRAFIAGTLAEQLTSAP